MNQQVIDAAVELGLYSDIRSPKGSPKESRLMPLGELADYSARDPWDFDPAQKTRYVFLYDRETRQERAFDLSSEIPQLVQERLEKINQVNSRFSITHQKYDKWNEEFTGTRRLRPIHYARFLNTFDQHGRLYTGKYGHQALRKIERSTIQFDGEMCVEPDYSGMHPRLIYHLEDIPFEGDPYALWGRKTSPPLRMMAKCMVNALINAKSTTAAISDCNKKMRTTVDPKNKQDKPKRKTGKALANALKLKEAQDTTGVTFKQVCERALEYHAPIRHRFGCDMGVHLMWIDSALALDILYHFAEQGIPCLSCHDSFIVPVFAANQLKAAMHEVDPDDWTGFGVS
jgi:hypothetical protein